MKIILVENGVFYKGVMFIYFGGGFGTIIYNIGVGGYTQMGELKRYG